MKCLLQAGLLIFVSTLSAIACAADARMDIKIDYPIKSPFYPVVLKGSLFPTLLSHETRQISVWSINADMLVPIPYQIDKVDDEGIYELVSSKRRNERDDSEGFDGNDELVLMASDLGKQLTPGMSLPPHSSLVEVELLDPHSGDRGWFYILTMESAANSKMKSSMEYVHYNQARDLIETDSYVIGFSTELPFLADTLQWSLGGGRGFSDDVIDTMKIRHEGKLFHVLPFERTHGDYSSKMVAVKDGPVRVIRRTENNVHIMFGIGSPSVYIDQILYRNVFVMDIIVDMPFRIGAIFSDLTAVPTIDGLTGPEAPVTLVHSESNVQGLPISGQMTDLKRVFNESGDKILVISSELGLIVGDIAAKDDSTIESRVYLVDDETLLNPPEDIPGQHGNAGFMMTGWEKLDSQVSHILFRSYLVQHASVADGIKLLKHSPRFH